MQHSQEKYLLDIINSVEVLLQFSVLLNSFGEYQQIDILTKDGVCRRLAIIGEAMNKLFSLDKSIAISDMKKIIGLRHIIVHDYDRIDDAIIYAILKKSLPLLKSEVQKILNNIS